MKGFFVPFLSTLIIIHNRIKTKREPHNLRPSFFSSLPQFKRQGIIFSISTLIQMK
jgi:hypothetical protein